MALKPVYFLLLWGLTLLTHGVTSMCNITCSTDYKALLNCSCSGSVLTHPVLLQVTCSGEEEVVEGSCEIKPPQSWCIIHQEDLDDVASIGTTCSAKAIQQDNKLIISQPSSWQLSEVVKPQPPFNVQVTHADTFNKITWGNLNPRDCLMYNIRIQDSKNLSKDPFLSFSVEKNYTEINHENLDPRVKYIVDIRAKMCPTNLYTGPWSEWSSTNTIEGNVGADQDYLWPLGFIIFPVLGIAFWFCFQKSHWRQKLQLITYIPKPDEFFKPLYHNYGGNFKEWVKPVFSEYDYLMINSQIQPTTKKPHDILQWNNEEQCYSEILETKKVGQFLQALQQPQNKLPLHFQDGGSSQGTSHSVGHISIHTVTLSGEEFEEEVMSQSSMNTLKCYKDGESFGSFEEDNRGNGDYNLEEPQLSRLDRQNGLLPQHENQISNELSLEHLNFQPHAQIHEPERLSLDSFASNDSNDGYPHVDLDTIDSGFVECSSPGASDSNRGDHIDSDLFNEHKNSNSNYVKQWMVCNTIQEDSTNSENELRETQ
ncbi:interleukin 21 receptor, tandem duplicate 1 [Echeneis naucrates]|uniref:Interleukin-21 receptor-like n=1 Tax=Echeneis naucrates TaxID=173247 RepID=A0A665UDZ7_ECHNA|nr:interleukin-21 receptor-like [Echeneis naucrates]XP_029360561.1 interleukin-21 receptor-like [Echeneis naucrates]